MRVYKNWLEAKGILGARSPVRAVIELEGALEGEAIQRLKRHCEARAAEVASRGVDAADDDGSASDTDVEHHPDADGAVSGTASDTDIELLLEDPPAGSRRPCSE